MNSKYFQIVGRLGFLLLLSLSFILVNGCEESRGGRRRDGLGISGLGINGGAGLSVAVPTGRSVWVLSRVSSQGAGNYYNEQLRSGRESLTSRASIQPTGGSYGLLNLVSVSDGSNLTASNLNPNTFVQYNRILNNYPGSVTGVETGKVITVDGISDSSYVDLTPDKMSILVSSPDSKTVTQHFLSESGLVIDSNKIRTEGRPTRFVAPHNFVKYPYAFVATDKGIETIVFDSVGPNGAGIGRLLGATQRADQVKMNPNLWTGVKDIAISADDSLIYVLNKYGQMMYIDMEALLQERPFSEIQQLPGRPFMLATPPGNIALDYVPNDSVLALTEVGPFFVNDVSVAGDFQAWNRLYSFKPISIKFHPDGSSVLALTDSKLFKLTLNQPEVGEDMKYVDLGYSGAREFSIDSINKKFAAVAVRDGIVFVRLENYGRVSAPTQNSFVRVYGETISVAVR